MKTMTAVFGSNQINRYGMIMSIEVLESQLNQTWNRPLLSSVGHDIHRARGYAWSIALHLQPGLARIFGAVSLATEEGDIELVQSVLYATLSRMEENLNPDHINHLRERLGNLLTSDGTMCSQNGVAFRDKRLANRVFLDLFAKQDKDGLIPISELKSVAPGIFVKDGLLLFAHPFFRRSLSTYNTLNSPFLSRLAVVAKEKSLDVRIALDEDVVGYPDSLQSTIEFEYWWGPHFSELLDEIKIGVARYTADDSERYVHGISGAEFWWYEQNGITSFECEEIRDLDAPSLGRSALEFGCRFVHSMLDKTTGMPIHLDGAVRLYDEGLMLERVDNDIMHFGRRAEYTKLWRVDGTLLVQNWKGLINDYYRDNHLVGEYFGGKEEEESSRSELIEIDQEDSIYEFVPCTMMRGDGIRIAISYHPQSELTSARVIKPIERYNRGEGWLYYTEASSIELIKLFKRCGEFCEIPEELVIVAFEDMVTNLPLIVHGDENAVQRAGITLEMISEYCLALNSRGDDRMVAFHLSVRFADRDVYFSFAGHIDDMCAWLQSKCAQLPKSVDSIGAWADTAGNWLTGTFSDARDIPPMMNMIKESGLLTIDRKFLKPSEYYILNPEKEPVEGIEKSPSIERAMSLVEEKRLVVAKAAIVKESTCTKCNGNYHDCECIKIVDADVGQRIINFEGFGLFWTDRQA